jgi:Barrel-sandwich domain of CusB or HlyD membrane-fusion
MNAAIKPVVMQTPAVLTYANLEERARAAKTVAELNFIIANETYQLMPYRQAILWDVGANKSTRLKMVSGLAKLTDDSPNTVYLKRLGRELAKRLGDDGEYLTADDLKGSLAKDWSEWLPDYLLSFTIKDPQGNVRAIIGFALIEAADDQQQEWLIRLLGTYGHAWGALAGPLRKGRQGWWRRPAVMWGAGLLALAALFIPVRLSVLANAEIIPLDAMAVAAPMDGVIKQFHVTPNQLVKKNDLLISLEDTTLRNRKEVAIKQLAVAKADALSAAQKAFQSEQSRSELATLNGRVAEREAEVMAVDEAMSRVEIRSPRDGIAVFGDVNDWQGKPVVTGERIVQLADPKDAGVLVWLPVADAINLEPGAPVRLFVQVAPLKPLNGKIVQTSYQVSLSPDGIASYRLRARFDELNEQELAIARIGLKGTAKLYGERASLGYYLLRRPLATLRELTGF